MVSEEAQKGLIQQAERAAKWSYWLLMVIVLNAALQLCAVLFPAAVVSVIGQSASDFWSLNLGICVALIEVGWGITLVQTHYLRRALGLPR